MKLRPGHLVAVALTVALAASGSNAQVVFTDVSEQAGIGLTEWLTESVAWGDYDNDGDVDLYVVNFQRGFDVLYRNDGPVEPGGTFQFTDVTVAAGTTVERSSRGMTIVDCDRDGLLDIFVNAIGPNILYHNLGDGSLVDIAGGLDGGADFDGRAIMSRSCGA